MRFRLSILVFVLFFNNHDVFTQNISLVNPKNNEVLCETTMLFEWNYLNINSSFNIEFSQDSLFQSIFFDTITIIDQLEINSELFGQKTWWRVISNSDTSNFGAFTKFCPNELSGCLLWVKSDSIGGYNSANLEVYEWVDHSGNGHDLNQPDVNKQPNISVENYEINNYPSVFFQSQERLISPELNIDNFEVFILFKSLNSNVINSIFSVNNSSYGYKEFPDKQLLQFSGINYRYFLGTIEPNRFKIHNLSVSNGSAASVNSFLKINNILAPNGAAYPSTGFFINQIKLGVFTGEIVEFLITDNLNPENNNLLNSYLMDKYAPPINLGQNIFIDYGFCDISLSSPSYYNTYLWSNGSTDSSIIINEPGEYWLEGIDIFGRTSRDSIIISRPPYDDLQLQNQLVCFNEPDTITANLPQGSYTFVQWSDGNTNPTRILDQNESISYTVVDSLGCSGSSNPAVVSIDNSLESISLGVDTSLCAGNSIQLIQSSSNITNWLWNNQDTAPTLSIDTSGVYILDIINDNGCQNSDTIEVTVIGTAPSLSYSLENEICQGSPLNFAQSSTVPTGNTINEVIWNFGEVDSVFSSSGAQIYQDSGLYAGFLEVSTLEGCSSKESFDISVHPKPITTFETTNYCPYENINFEASNEYAVPLNSFNWNFDQEGNTSIEINPSYNFGVTGNYNVELIAIDTNNCIDTVTQNVYVQPAPVVDISILNPCEYAVWDLTDNSSIADTFEITTYNWNYGDDTDSINPVQGKYYENYGDYTVQLILTADNGCMDTSIQNLIVHPNPIINYQVGPACKNTLTEFDDMSIIPQGSIIATDWLFNLQFEDNMTNTYFNFPTTGIQLVALTSTSDQGCIGDTTFTVDVNEELNANFNINPEILVSDVPISFINTSVGSDSSYWDFGNADGLNYNNDIQNSITYSSLLNGTYVDITLITVNDFGCRDTISKTLLVNEALYDINLETLFAQDINGFLTVGVQIENLGTIPLESLNLTLKTPENGPIQENWSGSILQGENEIYIFNAQPSAFISDQDATERFVCVEAQNTNNSIYLDINQENNTKCKNIEGSGFTLVSVYPNPTDEDITISILLSETSSIQVELYDQTGRMVYKSLNEEMEPGIHDFNMPFSTFESGIYSLRVFDGNLIRLEKIVKR